MRRLVESVEELRAIVGEPDHKVKDRLSAVQRQWLAHSPLCFVATTDALGRVDGYLNLLQVRHDWTQEQRDEYYSEANYRKTLY